MPQNPILIIKAPIVALQRRIEPETSAASFGNLGFSEGVAVPESAARPPKYTHLRGKGKGKK